MFSLNFETLEGERLCVFFHGALQHVISQLIKRKLLRSRETLTCAEVIHHNRIKGRGVGIVFDRNCANSAKDYYSARSR